MPSALNPREAARQDYRGNLVALRDDAIASLEFPGDLQPVGTMLAGSALEGAPAAFIPFFVILNVLNYQFWDVSASGEFVRYEHEGRTGALAMEHALFHAWVAALPERFRGMASQELVAVAVQALRTRLQERGVAGLFGAIPNPTSRKLLLLEVLDEQKLAALSKLLTSRLAAGRPIDWRDAQVLANLLPCGYADRYLKKAQLTMLFLAAEWKHCHPEQPPFRLELTACADYQLPKVLRAMGVLEYSADLAAAVDAGALIEADSEQERAIRSATVLACDALANRFGVSIGDVDNWLWLNRNGAKNALFHRTRTTAY